ncbi:MAG: hypothetical protein ACKOOI_06360, partial [Pirellula sp.]
MPQRLKKISLGSEGQFGRTDHNVKRFVGGKSGVLLLFPTLTTNTPLIRLPRIPGKYGPGWPN